MSFRTVVAAGALCLAVLPGCNRGAQAPAGPPSFPPAAVKLETAKPAPIEDTTEYVATLKSLRSTTIQPQIDGQITQIFVKSGDRVAPGRAADADRSAPPAGRRVEPGGRARRRAKPTSPSRGSSSSAPASCSRPARSASRSWSRPRRRCARPRPNLQALQAQVQQQEVQLRYFTVTAPTAGIVGDVPVRVGNQVTPQTRADDDRSERDARALRVGADRARAAS